MWKASVYYRTQADVDYAKENQSNVSEELIGALDFRGLQRIEDNSVFLANYLNENGFPVTIQERSGAWFSHEYLTDIEMNRIVSNVNAIREAYYDLSQIPSVEPVELGGLQGLTYSFINSIEYIQYMIELLTASAESGKHRLAFKLGSRQFGNRRI